MINFLISYFVVILLVMIYVVCFNKCTQNQLHINIKKVIVTMILSLIIMLNNLFVFNFFKTLVCYLCIMLVCRFWTGESYKRVIYYSLVFSILSLLIELIISKSLAIWFDGLKDLNQNFFIKTAFSVVLIALMYFIVNIRIIRKGICELEKVVDERLNYIVIIMIIIVLSNFLLTQYNLNYKNNKFYFISLFVVILVTSLMYFLLKSNFVHEKLKIKNQYLLESVKNYEMIADDYKELRHNLNADFIAIRSIANEPAKELIDEKLKKYHKNYNWTANISNIPKGLQGFLYIKLYEIKTKHINLEINSNISNDITSRIKAKDYSILCDALDITINNAVEAASQSKEKIIYINIMEELKTLKIKIMNTFENSLDIENIGKKNYSTKKRKSGIGLNYLNKQNEIEIKKEIINNIFIISLIVKVK